MEQLAWETIEYLHSKKTTDWYWIVGAITVSIAVIAIIFNNIIFAILILVSAFTLVLFASKPPNIVQVRLRNSGITLNHTHYNYSDLDSFWVETEDPNPKLILKSKKVLMPLIIIFIEDMHPEDIREFLIPYLKEERHVEPFLEKLLVYLGF